MEAFGVGVDGAKFQFRWGSRKVPVGEFVASVERVRAAEDARSTRKCTWNLPAVVMVVRGFDAGGGQRPLAMGEIFAVISIKVQKRVRLLSLDNTIITLPLSSNLKFHEFSHSAAAGGGRKKDSKPRSLRSHVKNRSEDKDLFLELSEEFTGASPDPYALRLSGHLMVLEVYEENFLVVVPIRDAEGMDASDKSPSIVPGYYPVELVAAVGLVDGRGGERIAEFLDFLAVFFAEVNAGETSALFEELTISASSDKLYDEIDDDPGASWTQKRSRKPIRLLPQVNENFSSLESNESFQSDPRSWSLPEDNTTSLEMNSFNFPYFPTATTTTPSTTASSPNLRIHESTTTTEAAEAAAEAAAAAGDERQNFTRWRNRRNVNKKKPANLPALPRTPVYRSKDQQLFFSSYPTSSPFSASSTSPPAASAAVKSNERRFATVGKVKKHSLDATPTKVKLTSARSLVNISSADQYEDYRDRERRLATCDDHQSGKHWGRVGEVWVEKRSRKSEGKTGRGSAFSQLFQIFKRSRPSTTTTTTTTTMETRKNKTLSRLSIDLGQSLSTNHRDETSSSSFSSSDLRGKQGRVEGDREAAPSDHHRPRRSSSPSGLPSAIGDYDAIDSAALASNGDATPPPPHHHHHRSSLIREGETTSGHRPLSRSLGDLTSTDDPPSSGSDRHVISTANRETPAYSSVAFPGDNGREAKPNPRAETESASSGYEDYEEIASPPCNGGGSNNSSSSSRSNRSNRRRPDLNTRGGGGGEGDNYLDMSSAYITSDVHSRWTSISQVPDDLGELEVKDVCWCLEMLNLGKHADRFRREQVDGRLLSSLTEDILLSDLQMTKFEAVKLMKFAKEAWRPK